MLFTRKEYWWNGFVRGASGQTRSTSVLKKQDGKGVP